MRVDRCFAFVDLCGFTAFTDRHGDERAVVILAELRTALREACARRGVRIVKWLGDGAMLSSTMIDAVVALTVELDARMAERLPSLAVRAGLDFGPVIMFEGDDYIGRPVNVAARLCDLAAPHELLATAAVAAGIPPWVTAGEKDNIRVHGLDRPLRVSRLSLGPPGEDTVTDPVCGLALPRTMSFGSGDPSADGTRFCSSACAGAWRP